MRPRADYRYRLLVWTLSTVIALYIFPGLIGDLGWGWRGPSFNQDLDGAPSGEKPQSKLWWQKGNWWAVLWDDELHSYAIHRFQVGKKLWVSTGVTIDDRPSSRCDVLSDDRMLYIASQPIMPAGAHPDDSGAKFYRYRYDTEADRYFPVDDHPELINHTSSETCVIDKDSMGRIWATWTQQGRVMITHTDRDGRNWIAPFQVPVAGSQADADDISSIIAINQRQIGLMWSNQLDSCLYFAVHRDLDPDQIWQTREIAKRASDLADDHLNMKFSAALDSTLYVVRKTNADFPEEAQISLMCRRADGVWTSTTVAQVQDQHSRPMLLIDDEHSRIYVFLTILKHHINGIFMKCSDAKNIFFPPGLGKPFIVTVADRNVNNATSTKQAVNSRTGLMVLASDGRSRRYLYNYLTLGAACREVNRYAMDN